MRTNVGAKAGLRFRVIAPLGTGGFGAVYEAIDSRTGQHVALKQLDDISADSIARFKQEFRALSDCHHPNLVGLKELIEEDGRWLIVMELVPGCDFVSFVRSADNDNQLYDEQRLRHALRGMAQGLAALHDFGILHRDLKPSNVRVTPEGRAVLLDFGLATKVDPALQSTHLGAVGTVAYMAPEQATRANVGPAADWYSLGVCLFEAVAGKRPFDGETPFQILTDKQLQPAPRLSTLVPDVPTELDELCAQLLERDPSQRAGAREVFALLGDASPESAVLTRAAHAQVPFAGRDAELLQLERGYERSQEGALRIVLVEGESGVGKSELVAEFVRRVRATEPTLLALHGRCYENEQVSFKAFDGCIDELARWLGRLPEREAALLLPPRSVLLGQLFPVLRTVRALEKAPRGEPSVDPTARRLEAFSALSALLHKLATDRPLVLVIDDLQWADAESFRLLLALLESPEPPPLLVVATIRPPEELEPDVVGALELLRRRQRMDVVSILGLPKREAAALAHRLLGGNAPAAYCEMIADESHGHPLFLSELVQFAQSHDLAARGALTLEAALRARIERLGPKARALLEMAAVAGRPYGSHVLARAVELDGVEEPARTLLGAKLLRVRKGQELGCYHDRIRHTAVALIAKSRLAHLHRQLAAALALDPLVDAVEQARHWDAGGERELAVAAYEKAAEAALAGLAFMRAAEACARAEQLIGNDADPRSQRLLTLHGRALACAGRSSEAAAMYARALERASGTAQHQLRVDHAQQLLIAGKLEAGIASMRAVLRELGVTLPKSMLGTVVQILWNRLWLALRGTNFKARPARPGEETHVFTSVVLGTFTHAIAPLHPLLIALVTLRALRHTPKVPTPRNLLQLYAGLGWLKALGGAIEEGRRLVEKCDEMMPLVDDPIVHANVAFVRGSMHLLNFEHGEATQHLARAQHIMQTRCPDAFWLLRNVRYHLGQTWFVLGQHDRVAEATEAWIHEARERNDPISVALFAGFACGFVRHLMRDAPDDVHAEIEGAMREVPNDTFSFAHLGEVIATAYAHQYRGGPTARDWLAQRAARHDKALILRSPAGRRALAMLRATAALHAYPSDGPKQRAVGVAQVRRTIKDLERSRVPMLCVQANLLRAQVHLLNGERARSLAAAKAAVLVGKDHMHNSAVAARYLVARLESGSDADPRCLAVLQSLRDLGFREPLRYLESIAPLLIGLRSEHTAQAAPCGLLLGRYEVVRTLGTGGFGSVVEARDVESGRAVALKELVSKSPRSLERFKHEFRALRDLHHPNLARLDALLEERGSWYIAMELVPGEPLLEYVRPAGTVVRARVEAVFEQLASALAALHEAGFAHRDVAPHNVLVTSAGRAVLLDYGLIGRFDDSSDAQSLGNVAYAAPEQLVGARPSQAADVYALGVCLYQALEGELPYEGHPTVGAKRALRPIGTASELPDLQQLALDMLASEPSGRPTLPEVRARLSGGKPPDELPVPGFSEQTHSFAGREQELVRLSDSFEATCDEGLALTLVEGESGLGKSALVAEFGRSVARQSPHALVLRARCYEDEQLAYKAFDGAIDELARVLRAMPSTTCESLLPKQAALLAQLFPVLATVPAIAQAPKRGLPADPSGRKREALRCLVELFRKLTSHFELLVFIDDLQWADADSFDLLRRLLHERETLPMMIVATIRPGDELSREVSHELAQLAVQRGVDWMTLAGLSDADARRMITELSPAKGTEQQLARLIEEAKGHPLFLRELALWRSPTSSGAATLEGVLAARIRGLEAGARELLSLVAIASKPHESHVLSRASELASSWSASLTVLLGHGLVRRHGRSAIAPYHDRVARTARELLSDEESQKLSAQLARALELEPRPDPNELARLWDRAGIDDKARPAHEAAGDHAYDTLQFARAAEHYARALALYGDGRDEGYRSLLRRSADALARSGRSADAAEAYAKAAEGASGEAAVRLRIRAAEHAIQSAQAEAGLESARQVLAELGITLPRSAPAATLRIFKNRALLALRGRNLAAPRAPLTQSVRMRLEAAWALAPTISWVDPLSGALLTTLHLRAAYAAGEPTHLARALSVEAFARALANPNDPKSDALMLRARTLAATHGDPALDAEVSYREASVATYRWDLNLARARLEHAMHTLTERCSDRPWLLTSVRAGLGSVWSYSGEHAQLAADYERWSREAQERGDRFALATLSGVGFGFLTQLMADDPDAVSRDIAERATIWPHEPFSFIHLGDLIARVHELLYRGGEGALGYLDEHAQRHDRAVLLRSGMGRSILITYRALASLAAYCRGPRSGDRKLLARTRDLLTKLERERSAFALHMAPFLRAQLCIASDQRAEAHALLARVVESAERVAYAQHATRARYLDARLRGGAAERELCEGVLASYRRHGWRVPHAGVRLFTPVLELLPPPR